VCNRIIGDLYSIWVGVGVGVVVGVAVGPGVGKGGGVIVGVAVGPGVGVGRAGGGGGVGIALFAAFVNAKHSRIIAKEAIPTITIVLFIFVLFPPDI
jgi:hypothetical protein